MSRYPSGPKSRLKSAFLFWGLFVAISVAFICPIWLTEIFPSTDLYGHMATLAIFKNLLQQDHFHTTYFVWGTFPSPNSLFPLAGLPLAMMFGVTIATKLIQSLYIIATPLSSYAFLRTFGRNHWLTFLSFFFIYNMNFTTGYIDYAISIPLFFIGISCTERFCREPGLGRFCWTALLGILVYFAHMQTFVVYCFCATALMFMHIELKRAESRYDSWLKELGALLLRGLTLVPGILCFLPWFLSIFVFRTHKIATRWSSFGKTRLHFHNWKVKLTTFYDYTISPLANHYESIALAGLLFTVLIILVFRRKVTSVEKYGHRLEWLTILLIIVYFAAPSSMTGQEVISQRLPSIICLALIGWLSSSLFSRKWLLFGLYMPMIILVLGLHAFSIYNNLLDFRDKEIYGLKEVMSSAHKNSRLTQLIPRAYTKSRHFNNIQLWNVHQLHYVWNDGITHHNFLRSPHRIMQKRDHIRFGIGGTAYGYGWQYNRRIMRHYDYILTRREQGIVRHPQVRIWKQKGKWILYRIKQKNRK